MEEITLMHRRQLKWPNGKAVVVHEFRVDMMSLRHAFQRRPVLVAVTKSQTARVLGSIYFDHCLRVQSSWQGRKLVWQDHEVVGHTACGEGAAVPTACTKEAADHTVCSEETAGYTAYSEVAGWRMNVVVELNFLFPFSSSPQIME